MDKMKELRVVLFRPWHFKALRLRPEEGDPDRDMLGEAFYHGGPAYSFADDKGILFCAGIVLMMKGVGEAWSFCDRAVSGYPREVLFYQKEQLTKEMTRQKLHRVQAHCLTSWRAAWRFLEHLGFQREGVVRKYDPEGRDYYLYSMIKE